MTPEESRRRREAALAGHVADEPAARRFLLDPSAAIRATALAALGRMGQVSASDVEAALADVEPLVRRRACEVAIDLPVELLGALADPDASVAEAAAWALGERGGAPAEAVEALSAVATGHDDALCREAAVASLGAIGDERGLPAVLAATADKPAIRRRAVIALAPFDGALVAAALQRALADRDWQVRQAAEDLLGDRATG